MENLPIRYHLYFQIFIKPFWWVSTKKYLKKPKRISKLPFHKKVAYAAEQDRPDVAEKRAEWKVRQLGLNPKKLVFVDESGAKINMTRRYGRALKSKPIVDKVLHGHWQSLLMFAALGRSGVIAPQSFVGGHARFIEYVRDVLCPSLKRNDIVVMNNLSVHRVPVFVV